MFDEKKSFETARAKLAPTGAVKLQLPSLPQALRASHALSPISSAVLARRGTNSFNRTPSLPMPSMGLAIRPLIKDPLPADIAFKKGDKLWDQLKSDKLWDQLESDPVEPEDIKQRPSSSPRGKHPNVRMEDYLGSGRKKWTVGPGLPVSPMRLLPRAPTFTRSNTAPQLPSHPTFMLPLAKPAPLLPSVGINSTLSSSNVNNISSIIPGKPKKKRTYSYANAHVLHRSISLDRIKNKDTERASVASLDVTRPSLIRAHSYQEPSAIKKFRLEQQQQQQQQKSQNSDVSVKANNLNDIASSSFDEPDLTFSTLNTGDAASVHSDSDVNTETDVENSKELDEEDNFDSGSSSSEFESSLSTARTNSQTSLEMHPGTTQADYFYNNKKNKKEMYDFGGVGMEKKKGILSQMERDCAAVLLGMGSTI